ncbi:MAG: hypothetical protein KatS3mg091_747 [Patescibacteria group bacterium]|nr:MAG: hypothetical protein KatS3mg091_747 [Patescibacteria group bacterium]
MYFGSDSAALGQDQVDQNPPTATVALPFSDLDYSNLRLILNQAKFDPELEQKIMAQLKKIVVKLIKNGKNGSIEEIEDNDLSEQLGVRSLMLIGPLNINNDQFNFDPKIAAQSYCEDVLVSSEPEIVITPAMINNCLYLVVNLNDDASQKIIIPIMQVDVTEGSYNADSSWPDSYRVLLSSALAMQEEIYLNPDRFRANYDPSVLSEFVGRVVSFIMGGIAVYFIILNREIIATIARGIRKNVSIQ